MATWQNHCDYIKSRGTVNEVMIVATETGVHYASSPTTFQLREYKAMIMKEETMEEVEETVNEAKSLVEIIRNAKENVDQPKRVEHGLRVNSSKKYQQFRTFLDEETKQPVVYGRGAKIGVCVACAGKVIIIGTFEESKEQSSAGCNETIELMARYIYQSTWPDGSEGNILPSLEQARLTWKPFVDKLLLGKGNVASAMILRKSDCLCYAYGKLFFFPISLVSQQWSLLLP
jgi:hypothetical protein